MLRKGACDDCLCLPHSLQSCQTTSIPPPPSREKGFHDISFYHYSEFDDTLAAVHLQRDVYSSLPISYPDWLLPTHSMSLTITR